MAKFKLPKGKGKKQNKQLLLVGGGAAAVVAVAALMHRKSAAASGANSGTPTSTTGVQGTYDSTANDVYNSIEPQIEGLSAQIAAIAQGQRSGGSSGATVPPPVKPPVTKKPPKGFGGKPPSRKPLPGRTVTLQHGQTLGQVAKSHGETLAQLHSDNPVYWSNPRYRSGTRVFAGDKVKVRR